MLQRRSITLKSIAVASFATLTMGAVVAQSTITPEVQPPLDSAMLTHTPVIGLSFISATTAGTAFEATCSSLVEVLSLPTPFPGADELLRFYDQQIVCPAGKWVVEGGDWFSAAWAQNQVANRYALKQLFEQLGVYDEVKAVGRSLRRAAPDELVTLPTTPQAAIGKAVAKGLKKLRMGGGGDGRDVSDRRNKSMFI